LTPAEYLTARGWASEWRQSLMTDEDRWNHRLGRWVTLAEALALQLAEDRAVFAFVASQSETTIVTRSPLFPDDVPHTEDVRVVGVRCEEKKP
jgi:hypothetical protein